MNAEQIPPRWASAVGERRACAAPVPASRTQFRLLPLLAACLSALALAGLAQAQTVTLSVPANAEVAEGDGATTITVTAAISPTSSSATSIALALSAGTASSEDYQIHGALPTIRIPANSTSATADITLTAVDDPHFEGTQTLVIGGSSTGITVNDVSLPIRDNDTVPVPRQNSVADGANR